MEGRMSSKLTDRGTKGLEPRSSSFIEFDTVVTGFGIRVTPNGAKSFVIDYRNRSGRQRRYTIGKFPTWSVTAAREEAKRLLQKVGIGGDPVVDRNKARGGETMADLAERYVEEYLPKKRPKSQFDDRSMIRLSILPAMGTTKVKDVDRMAVRALHRKITRSGTPNRANAVLRLLSTMFNLAVEWGMRADNPAKGIEKNPEEPRERYLSRQEIERLKDSLVEEQDRESVAVILLAMLTGARMSEIVKATWDQFDLDNGIWTKPSAHTKQKRIHRVPLSPRVLEMLKQLREESPHDKLVFPVRGKIGTVRPAWDRVRSRAGLEDVRFHDLRHSFASLLAGGGMSLLMIGKLLGHTQQRTTARYAHVDVDPLRDAVERVSKLIGEGGA
jgi:integrase